MHPTGYRSSEILEIVSRAVIGLGSGQHPRLARVLADQADTEITEREALEVAERLEEAATQVADSEAPHLEELGPRHAPHTDQLQSRLLLAAGRELGDHGLPTDDTEVAAMIDLIENRVGGGVPEQGAVSALESLCTEMAEYGPALMAGIDVSGITGAVTFPEVTAATQDELDAGAELVTAYADGAEREAQMFSGIDLDEATALTIRERVEHAVAQVASSPRGACAAQEQTSEVSR